MSSGTGIPLDKARTIVAYVMNVLNELATSDMERAAIGQLEDVGSLRRMKPLVGDLEALAPLPQAFEDIEIMERNGDKLPPVSERPGWDHDPLFRVLCRIVDNPPSKPRPIASVLWLPTAESAKPEVTRHLGTAEQGLKPGFKSCRIVLHTKMGDVKMEVFRAARDAYGWAKLMRTGPDDFGKHFLYRWKLVHGIPLGDEASGGGKASIDGYLVDGGGKVVSVPTEEDAFREARMEWVEPEHRAEWISRKQIAREVMR